MRAIAHLWSISTQAGRNGQSEPIGAQTDAKATMGASPCPTDLSSNHAERDASDT